MEVSYVGETSNHDFDLKKMNRIANFLTGIASRTTVFQIESLLLKSNRLKRFNRELNAIAIWIWRFGPDCRVLKYDLAYTISHLHSLRTR